MAGKIRRGEPFSGYADDGSFFLAVDEYVPYVCAAIHNGGNLRKELLPKMLLSRAERWKEEDPQTGRFISSFPIRIIAHDSRYEYDLNRTPGQAIYREAWGKKVWRSPLNAEERRASLAKHRRFYRVMTLLIETLEERFGRCLVFDIHSFCRRGRKRSADPLFNVGTKNIDRRKHRKTVDAWLRELARIRAPHVTGRTAENENFQGEGFLLKHLTARFDRTLVLATEIKKVYCDEDEGDVYPAVVHAISEGLKTAVLKTAAVFNAGGGSKLLSRTIGADVREVDAAVAQLNKGVELLDYVNPVNKETARDKFFRSGYRVNPKFRQRPLPMEPIAFKRAAYSIPVTKIRDPQIQSMYRDIVEAQVSLVEMMAMRGTKDFLFESLKQFGEPSATDLANARYLAHYPEGPEPERPYGAEAAARRMRACVKLYGQDCRVVVAHNLSAKAMFAPARRVVELQAGARFSEDEITALGHHEVGVHLLTTVNAAAQPLHFPRAGMPAYSYTQEGLAILSEYLSGAMHASRLRELGLRVLAVRSMIRDYDFKTTFEMLVDACGLEPDRAFDIAVRAYRSGGMTKDYLYLSGFKRVHDLWRQGDRWRWLLTGKVSVEYLDLLEELVNRGFLKRPALVPIPFKRPKKPAQALAFLVDGIR